MVPIMYYLLAIRGGTSAIHILLSFLSGCYHAFLYQTCPFILPPLHPKDYKLNALYTYNNSRFHLISADAPVKYFDDQVMRDAKVVDGSPDGRASFEIRITPYYGNINGVLHGGAAGVIFDMLTTPALAPLSRPDYWEYVFHNL